MTPAWLLDLGIAALALALAVFSGAARTSFAAIAGYVALGLLLALAWLRLGAPDVALTAVAVGGLGGVLLIGAARQLGTRDAAAADQRPSGAVRAAAALLAAGVAAGLAAAVLALPATAPTLAPDALRELPKTGLGNPVTGALIAFRAIDTLAEKVVLLLALVGVWSLAPDRSWAGRPASRYPLDPDGVLAFLVRLLAPIGVLFGCYILWVSSEAPGGAFQGGAILAAMWLAARMAGLTDAPALRRRWLRWALAVGPLVFFAAGLAGPVLAGAFLAWPVDFAKPLIVAVEIPLTLSIAAALGLLLAGPPRREDGQ